MRAYPTWPVAALLLVGAVLSFACCTKDIPPPDNALEEPAQLRAAIDARLEQVDTARFKEVVLDYFGEGDRVKVRQLILVERPDMLRVQTRLPGSDEILSLLVSDGETFAMHKRDTNEYLTGQPTPENINRLLPVDLSAPDVVRVMLGGAPWDRFARAPGQPGLRWDRQAGEYVYSVETATGGTLSMYVRHTDYAVTRVVERTDDGDLVYEYTTDDWRRRGPVALPAWRRFVWPARDLDFSLDVGETQVGIELPDTLFELPPPPGSEVIHVDTPTSR